MAAGVAIDGFDLDLPDTEANAAEFGYAGSGNNRVKKPAGTNTCHPDPPTINIQRLTPRAA